LALGEGGQQTAPLGRAVIGGLLAATVTTLLVLPSIFAIVQGGASTRSVSLDPDDLDSPAFDGGGQSIDGRATTGRAAAGVAQPG
jgi:hypothetical protein